MATQVDTLMTRNVKTLRKETTIAEIARLFIEARISGAPVVSADGTLVGMVSEADLLHRSETGTETRRPWWRDLISDPDERAKAFVKAHGRTAAEVMTDAVEIVAPDTHLHSAAKLMDERNINRLPVVEDGKLVGIITRADMVRALLAEAVKPTEAGLDDLAIKDRFEETTRAAGFSTVGSVTAMVDDGIVDLWGIVSSAAERRALEVAAAEIPGVCAVRNHLALRDTITGGI